MKMKNYKKSTWRKLWPDLRAAGIFKKRHEGEKKKTQEIKKTNARGLSVNASQLISTTTALRMHAVVG